MIVPALFFASVIAIVVFAIIFRVISARASTATHSLSSLSRHFPDPSANPASPPAPFDSDPLNPMMAVQLMNESSSHDTRHFEPTHHHTHDSHHFHDPSSAPEASHSHSHDSSSSFDSSSSSFDSSSSSSDSSSSSSCDSSSSSSDS